MKVFLRHRSALCDRFGFYAPVFFLFKIFGFPVRAPLLILPPRIARGRQKGRSGFCATKTATVRSRPIGPKRGAPAGHPLNLSLYRAGFSWPRQWRDLVISWKTMRLMRLSSLPLAIWASSPKPKACTKCQEIASPSRSSSVANIIEEASLASFFNWPRFPWLWEE